MITMGCLRSGDVRVKSLLVIGLAVAQLLSWGAPAIHLCIRSNGALCVDCGPENCRCSSAHVSDQGEGCCSHERCGDGDQGPHGDRLPTSAKVAASVVGFDGCDCTHIQLSWSQPPSLSASSNFVDFAKSLAHDGLCSHDDSNGSTSADIVSERPTRQRSLSVNWSLVVSTANLRC